MSREVKTQFEVRDMRIMKDVLASMGIDYNEINSDQLSISRNYRNIVIDANEGTISCDSVAENEVNQIKQNYTVAFVKDRAIKEGMHLQEVMNEYGEVVLTLNH